LFIITADHSTHSEQPKYNTPIGRFAIPALIFDPSKELKGKYSPLFQQIDIAPSLLGWLGIPTKSIAFGRNIFNENPKKPFVVNFINGVYQLYQDNYVLFFDGKKTIAFYDISKDELLMNNLLKTELNGEELIKKTDMEVFMKAIVQQYNNRLINNQLSISK